MLGGVGSSCGSPEPSCLNLTLVHRMNTENRSNPQLNNLAVRLRSRRISLLDYYPAPVTVERVEVEGNMLFLQVRTHEGELKEIAIEPAEADRALSDAPRDARPLVDANGLFLLIESSRIRLSYAYDPYFAVSLSGVEALPHQLEAVYHRMLPQARLRFLLADEPGAGKTIMAGLLVKELKLRGAIDRVLILCPAPLCPQWQDEMSTKFDEIFEWVRPQDVRDQLAGNVWDRFPQCVSSIDFAKREEILPGILQTDWDFIIIDEAHKCSARTFGNEIKKTKRYQLAEALSREVERLLLLTATPHSGDAEQFSNFLRLIDPDQFGSADLSRDLLRVEDNPWFLRRMKESLRDFDGKKIFTARNAFTQPFELSASEQSLYNAVTEYINTYLSKGTGRKKHSVALARMVLQRRLASSLRAINRSIERRHGRLSELIEELERLPPAKQQRHLAQLGMIEIDVEMETDDQEEGDLDRAVSSVAIADTIEGLRVEVRALENLLALAKKTIESGEERKLEALRECLSRAEFSELRDGRGKLLIFTEHRDTLEYLVENLKSWDYTTTVIHGGMDALRRKEAERVFHRDVQICVATEAAGEGINLQFCHLMINYDIPWNPNRLEQRMGRIHRIGQIYDVTILNFVAINTVEGRILEKLLTKMNEMRGALGERVFDVIGLMLRLNDLNLEDMLRDAALNPRNINDYLDKVEKISPERLKEFEEKTGIAMAVSNVDFGRIRERDYRSEERRLMPEYVERFFVEAADRTGLRFDARADGLWRVEHVPTKFRDQTLGSHRRYGRPRPRYLKLTFLKKHLSLPQHRDAEMLSPGHALFTAVTEVLDGKLYEVRQGASKFVDPQSRVPYRLHFFEIEVVGEEPEKPGMPIEPRPIFKQLTVLLEDHDGTIELAAPDILHDLTPTEADGPNDAAATAPEQLQKLDRWLKANVLHGLTDERRNQRKREMEIRHEYLTKSFDESIRVARQKWSTLAARVAAGEEVAKLARDEALKRAEELEARKERKLKDLERLRVVRPGKVTYLGTALVQPAEESEIARLMRRDDEVEKIAMQAAMSYERSQGWEPEDVSNLRDGSGFDVRSLGPAPEAGARRVRRIEVKGRSSDRGDVVLTRNEWLQAKRHGETYWLYVVWGCGGSAQQLVRIQNPAEALKQQTQELVEVKGYRVPAGAISDAAKGGLSNA